jgi:hypothetical protein
VKTGALWVRHVKIIAEPPSFILVAELRRGTIVPGMTVSIPLSSAVDVTARVMAVQQSSEAGELEVRLECENAEGAELLDALSVS